jgi:hypothetical protein
LLRLLLLSSDGCSNSDNAHPSNVMRSPHGTPSGGVMGSTLSWLSFEAHSTCSAASQPPGDYNMFALVMSNDDCCMFALVMISSATLSKDNTIIAAMRHTTSITNSNATRNKELSPRACVPQIFSNFSCTSLREASTSHEQCGIITGSQQHATHPPAHSHQNSCHNSRIKR